MGMSLSVSLNFYFEIDEELKKESFSERIRCSNNLCENHKNLVYSTNGDFCSNCGNPYERVTVSCGTSMPDAHDFCDEYLDGDEIVYNANTDSGIPENIWKYNFHTPFLKEDLGNVDLDDGGFVDLSKVDIEALITKFKKEDAVNKFLNAFYKVYGKDKIKVKFGIFSEYW